jgi:hypothetical protein
MIIKKHNLTKESVINIGNKYAASYFNRVFPRGYPEQFKKIDLTFKPEDIIITKEEAYSKVITPIVEWRKAHPPADEKARRQAEEFEQDMRNGVESCRGFVSNKLAYVPAHELEPILEVSLMKKISEAYPGRMPGNEEAWKSKFFSVDIQSELIHLLVHRAFGISMNRGIDETFDALSQTYLIPMNVRIVTVGYGLEKNEALEARLQKDYIDTMKKTVEYCDAFLSEGIAGLMKYMNIPKCKEKAVEKLANLIRKEYIYTSHYEPAKIALGLFNVSGSVTGACSRFGEIVVEPSVKLSKDILRAINYSDIAYIDQFFDKTLEEKFDILEDPKYKL